MHARSTTVTGAASAVDAGIAYVRDEVMPAITGMDGCVGMSLVVDREHGRLIATSSWRDEASMRASDEALVPMRQRGSEILGGTLQVEEWEVAVMHRAHNAHDGCCCRVTWGRTRDLDTLVMGSRTQLVPTMAEVSGFCSASLLIDRAGSRACSTITFDSWEAMDASRDFSTSLRDQAAETMAVEILDEAEFDLEIHHLRLPELV